MRYLLRIGFVLLVLMTSNLFIKSIEIKAQEAKQSDFVYKHSISKDSMIVSQIGK